MTNLGSNAKTIPSAKMSFERGANTGASFNSIPTPWPMKPAFWRCPIKLASNPAFFAISKARSYISDAATPGFAIFSISDCISNDTLCASLAFSGISPKENTRDISLIYPVKLPPISTIMVFPGFMIEPLLLIGSEGSSPAPPRAKS